jgi:general secretion pathway protein D
MKYTPAKSIQRIAFFFALILGLNPLVSHVYAQEVESSEKVQLLTEAINARNTGDLLLAKEKAEALVAIAPEDQEVQDLLLSLNTSIDGQSLSTASEAATAAAPEKKRSQSDVLSVAEVSPEFASQESINEGLLVIARAQIKAGDYQGARATLNEIEARNPNNVEAKSLVIALSKKVAQVQGKNLYKTRSEMLNAVDEGWERPKVFEIENETVQVESSQSVLEGQIKTIRFQESINFRGMQLSRVIESLSELSTDYDPNGNGITIVPGYNVEEFDPKVTAYVRKGQTLANVLDMVTSPVGYSYRIKDEYVTIQPSDSVGGASDTVTEFFDISSATVTRLTGLSDIASANVSDDPFGDSMGASSSPSQADKKDLLQKFFQNAGVNFEVPGASLAFDGVQLIVTQTEANIERLRTILRKYSGIKQVEIEAKFLEVAQNDLDEIGFQWGIVGDSAGDNYTVNTYHRDLTSVRPGGAGANKTVRIGQEVITASGTEVQDVFGSNPILSESPAVSQALDYGQDVAASFFTDSWSRGKIDLDLNVRALARKSGTDLMSAPKVTVISGKRATITVAQELIYPEAYGDMESTVSSGGETASSAISITSGTPEDFVSRNVGVEMSVTPTVESDDRITLTLQPTVTEFEGFVEYGGPSIALSGAQSAVVPSGFYQPIFSTRQIETEVTVYDGATVVMGGLTRDEVRSINDRVPVLGDLPGLGRFFRSEGETRQKRNLLIFVTANLVSPGGTLANQKYNNIKQDAVYQSPAVTTPSGNVFRNVTIAE